MPIVPSIAISVCLQAAAIVVALLMLRYNRPSAGWFALVALLGLQFVRRVLDLLNAADVGPEWFHTLDSAYLSIPLSAVVAIAMVFMLLDLRRRARAAEHLAEAEGRYGELFERNMAPMLLMRGDGPTIHDVNEAAAAYYGYRREEMRGMPMSQLCPLPYEAIREQTVRIQAGDDDRYRVPHRLASGDLRDVEIFAGTITVEGELLIYQMIVDVTERNRAQRALSDQNRTLEAAVGDRTEALVKTVNDLEHALAARQQFLAGMSHEFRTPLNSIIGYSSIMLGGLAGDLNEEQRKQLDMVSRSARHLLTLVNDVLDIAQLDHGAARVEPKDFSANDMVDEVANMMTPLVRDKGLDLVVVKADVDSVVFNDITKVEQILLNLVGNAVKFTPSGTVGISVDTSGDESVEFVVTDTGIGIPEVALRRVTEPFVQLQRDDGMKPSGVGLGLSISQRLAAALGGDLRIVSEPGVGSTFSLSVPRRYVRDPIDERDEVASEA